MNPLNKLQWIIHFVTSNTNVLQSMSKSVCWLNPIWEQILHIRTRIYVNWKLVVLQRQFCFCFEHIENCVNRFNAHDVYIRNGQSHTVIHIANIFAYYKFEFIFLVDSHFKTHEDIGKSIDDLIDAISLPSGIRQLRLFRKYDLIFYKLQSNFFKNAGWSR